MRGAVSRVPGTIRSNRVRRHRACRKKGSRPRKLKEKLEEAAEGAEGARAAWLTWLSLSTALIAVLAAIASLESGDHANEAIVLKTDATLTQSAADDAWAFYQAKSVKEDMYRALAPLAPRPEVAAEWARAADVEHREKEKKRREAEKLVAEVGAADRRVEESTWGGITGSRRAVTIFQVAIALGGHRCAGAAQGDVVDRPRGGSGGGGVPRAGVFGLSLLSARPRPHFDGR